MAFSFSLSFFACCSKLPVRISFFPLGGGLKILTTWVAEPLNPIFSGSASISCAVQTMIFVFFLMIRRPPRSTRKESSAASDVYKRQLIPFLPEWCYLLTQFFLYKWYKEYLISEPIQDLLEQFLRQ